jgi:hypothetical protein
MRVCFTDLFLAWRALDLVQRKGLAMNRRRSDGRDK